MSTPEQLIEQIRVATDYQINKRALKEKILTDLHLTYSGGLFLVDQTLLAFLATWPNEDLHIEDVYGNPIAVNRTEILEQAQQCYQAAMNSWHQQHEELKKIRKF